MPLIKTIYDNNHSVFVWKYDADEDEFLLKLWQENEKNSGFGFQKKMEFCMVRALLREKLPHHKINYNPDQSPFLDPFDCHLSISHSFPFACIAISENAIGVDIEKVKDKITKLQHKFILHESSYIPVDKEKEYLTVIWSIKEALYKIHPSNLWSLKKHYEIKAFDIFRPRNIACRVYDEAFDDPFTANVYTLENSVFLSIVTKA